MTRLFHFSSSMLSWVVQPLVILVIVVGGFYAASQLSLRQPPPKREQAAPYAPLVRTLTAEVCSHPVVVHGNGSLEARTRIDLVAQVGGEVLEIHEGLRTGGRFRAGELLARVEPRDYELAVSSAEAELTSAKTELVTLRAESEAAQAEWAELHPGAECPPLVRLEPQLDAAGGRVRSAEVRLDAAELDLERTHITLPFDGRVVEATVDVGEVVTLNRSLAVVYATDVYEVAVPLRVEEFVWLELPSAEEPGRGGTAVLRGAGAAGPLELTGRIARVHGELDPTSRLARVVVEVRASDLAPETASQLLPGTFVDVEFQGRQLEDAVQLPRGVLREAGRVWLVEDGILRFAQPTVLYRGNGLVILEGLAPGAQVVASDLEVVTDGMQVRSRMDEGAR